LKIKKPKKPKNLTFQGFRFFKNLKNLGFLKLVSTALLKINREGIKPLGYQGAAIRATLT